MDYVVLVSGILRCVVIGGIFAFNCGALVSVFFRSDLCLHNLMLTATLLANVLYLLAGWTPFVLYGLFDGSWILVEEKLYCLAQNFFVNAMAMVLAGLTVLRVGDRFRTRALRRPAPSPSRGIALTFAAWVLPQIAYNVVSIAGNRYSCGSPNFRFLDDLGQRFLPSNFSVFYTLGFIVCEQQITSTLLATHVWQFAFLILPMATFIIGCFFALQITKKRLRSKGLRLTAAGGGSISLEPYEDSSKEAFPRCRTICARRMTALDLIFCSNLIWQVVLRPLTVLQAVYWIRTDSEIGFLDIGSHAVLIMSSVVIPMVCRDKKGRGKGPEKGLGLANLSISVVPLENGFCDDRDGKSLLRANIDETNETATSVIRQEKQKKIVILV